MKIRKRNGQTVNYEREKIERVIRLAFESVGMTGKGDEIRRLTLGIEAGLQKQGEETVAVESIQDQVEESLMVAGHYEAARSFILYRNGRSRARAAREQVLEHFADRQGVEQVLKEIQADFPDEEYALPQLSAKFRSFCKSGQGDEAALGALIKAAAELTTRDAPLWEMIAARIWLQRFRTRLARHEAEAGITSLHDKLLHLTKAGVYGSYILSHYSKAEIDEYALLLQPGRDKLLNYSGLELLYRRYLIRTQAGRVLESPQEMFLGIALHLAMKEQSDRGIWVKRFYDMLSTLKVTMATPTLSNARKPFHQLSSCFIDTVPDSLDGIYRSIDNFAQVSKYGGGMGLYFGKVRATGSAIRGFAGAAGGVIRWIRLANDTAVAVDQLGVRQGAVAVYLDAWHRDLPEFLALRTNNGDDRLKAHDVFPAVCYPDYFWQQARDNIEGDWYLMCPHEIRCVKGYALEDSYGDEWEERYHSCVADARINKRVVPIKDLIRLILKSAVETGTPFAFNRDLVNRANPNKHRGIIYCSNLCTEIAQNMSAIESLEQQITTVEGETVVVTTTKPGDFVVCNLASLSLGRIDVRNPQEIAEITRSAVRALDNVIDLNFYPLPYAEITNRTNRPIGLGVSGYHHMLARLGLHWETQEHLDFADQLFEQINHAAISASCDTAREKGAYAHFEGSEWQTGAYFDRRGYTAPHWQELRQRVASHGLRNAWLLAVAPTSSTSIIAGTTAGIDPVMKLFFLEEKKNGLMPRVAPELSLQTLWLYKNAHHIDQRWSVRAAGVRQRHIDQAQSMNLYITHEYTLRQILNLYILAWECGVKTIYYIRSKSLEVEECELCAS
ncbi:MAG: ribonucleoside-diphosphate reductase subunit alpha [Akkermansia sp.]|nr:ribonucleoside-diphosphate reductase subunit alpha [Akkermansia sp.]MBR2313357.1 ribonucleoside-diphosphate reductase subunit alpha [Akkermansia sp.]